MEKNKTTLIEVLLLAVFVLAVRIAFEGAIPFFQNQFNLNFNETLRHLLQNYPLALLMVVMDFLLVWMLVRHMDYGKQPILRTLLETGGLVVIALGSAVLLRVMQGQEGRGEGSFFNYMYCIRPLLPFLQPDYHCGMDIYAYYARVQKRHWTGNQQKNKVTFQYHQLKHQMNPIFFLTV